MECDTGRASRTQVAPGLVHSKSWISSLFSSKTPIFPTAPIQERWETHTSPGGRHTLALEYMISLFTRSPLRAETMSCSPLYLECLAGPGICSTNTHLVLKGSKDGWTNGTVFLGGVFHRACLGFYWNSLCVTILYHLMLLSHDITAIWLKNDFYDFFIPEVM